MMVLSHIKVLKISATVRQKLQIRFNFDKELVMIQEPCDDSSIWWSMQGVDQLLKGTASLFVWFFGGRTMHSACIFKDIHTLHVLTHEKIYITRTYTHTGGYSLSLAKTPTCLPRKGKELQRRL